MKRSNRRRPVADPLEIIAKALRKVHSLWISQTYPFASIGKNVSFHFTSKVSRQRSPRIWLGNSIRINEHAWLNVATDDPNGEPTLILEDNCIVAVGSILSARNQIHLEHHVNVAQQVLILDHNHAYEDIDVPIIDQGITEGGRIRIGAGSWIGHGAKIICSRGKLTIGRHCVVAANAVVMQSMPDYSVAFGVPAKIIRQYDQAKGTWRIGQVKDLGASGQRNSVDHSSVTGEAEPVAASPRAHAIT